MRFQKWSWVVISLLLVIMYAFFCREQAKGIIDLKATSLVESISSASTVKTNRNSVESPVVTDIANSLEASKHIEVAADLKSWAVDHGYYVDDKNSSYNSYDENTLKKMAAEGDLRALTVMADFELQHGNIDAAKFYYEQSVIRGSTYALNVLGNLALPAPLIYEDEKLRIASYYESLAYFKVLDVRGDKFMFNNSSQNLIEIYHLNLSANDYKNIDDRARDIYKSMEERRIDVGLGSFDNTVPSAY